MGASWRGIPYFRSVAEPSAVPPSYLQLIQQKKLKVVMGWIKPLLNFINVGYQLYRTEQTPMNAAVSYHMKYALNGDGENFYINFEKGMFSKGVLVAPFIREFSSLGDNSLYVSWKNPPATVLCEGNDLATYIIYNPQKEAFVTFAAYGQRSDREVLLELPSAFENDEVHGYVFYINAAGNEVSTSVYLGKVKIIN